MHVTEEQKVQTKQFIQAGQSIEAVGYLKKELGLDLKTAMKLVQAIRDDMDPDLIDNSRPIRHRTVGKVGIIIPLVFSIVGLIMLGVTGYIYVSQQEVISQGNKVVATVIATPHNPLFEYEFNGQVYRSQSSTSSDPPSYVMGEVVDFYIDKNNPHNGIADTFTERWLLITIFGAMGSMFFGMGLIVAIVFSKR